MAGRLVQLLDPARIMLHVQSTEHIAALHEVAGLLANHPDVTDFQGFYGEILARDCLATTCLGDGIALPHARTEHVRKIVMAVGRSDQGVFFENGNQPVQLIFLLGTPPSDAGGYLQVVGWLCCILKDPVNRTMLLSAATPEALARGMLAAEARLLAPA
jgi:mannitol/fructose-specific phosphotransferase system IIA component (Ntr-type)